MVEVVFLHELLLSHLLVNPSNVTVPEFLPLNLQALSKFVAAGFKRLGEGEFGLHVYFKCLRLVLLW